MCSKATVEQIEKKRRMKSSYGWQFCLLFFLCLSAELLSGQKDSTGFQPQTYLGFQYGTNWNEVRFSPQINQDYLQGQRLAAILRHTSEKHLGIQLELAYDQRGWSESIDSLSTNYTREISYIELAAFTHISIGAGAVRPLILLGSYLSYPLQEIESIPADWDSSRALYYGQPLPERLQYGLAGGLGVELVLEKISFQIDGRYRSALGGIFATGDELVNFTFSNQTGLTAQLTLSYHLF
jgi:hypothetical protein